MLDNLNNSILAVQEVDNIVDEGCKNQKGVHMTEEKSLEMTVLYVLQNLGYPMDKLGTYLYKNVITSVIYILKEEPMKKSKLLTQLEDPFSFFYFNLARNELDMGVKTFHSYIEKSILEIDNEKIDKTLCSQIYNFHQEDIDYGQNALLIGHFIFKCMNTVKQEIPKIKMLRFMSNKELKF